MLIAILLGMLFLLSCTNGIEKRTSKGGYLKLNLRSRVEIANGSGVWEEVYTQERFLVNETAIVIIDMWDTHPCSGSQQRINVLAPKINSVIGRARGNGIQIIHAAMASYDATDFTDSQKMLEYYYPSTLEVIQDYEALMPKFPLEAGCDTDRDSEWDWSPTGGHPMIEVAEEDVVSGSDHKDRLYNFIQDRGIKNAIVMGVHANVCVPLNEAGIVALLNRGVNAILVRDLTDAYYDPRTPPYVSQEKGTELVVEHIEKYLCPSILSEDLLEVYHN